MNKNGSGLPASTETILESISDGVFTVDLEWRITSFNRAAEEITGVPREEAIGRRCADVFRCSMCGENCALARTVHTGKPSIGKSGYIIDAEGARIPISVSTAVLKDQAGNTVGGAETFRDLSEVEALRKELEGRFSAGDLVSRSASMQRILEVLPAAASSPSTVLILGETGTGKELLARTVHDLSPRRNGPFVAVNCGALPDTLLESELFGYKAGAFTGAERDKPGRFAMAAGGSLFLDEIADVSQALQVRLLRVLQEKTYEPLGSTKTERTDVRIIAAANKDLSKEVREGRFREDLFYRINVVPLKLPPLRKRKEDIPVLADQFIRKFNILHGKNIEGIGAEALSLLLAHDWPGNVRELENVMERSFILRKEGVIGVGDLPDELASRENSGGTDIRTARDMLDAQTIRSALKRNNYNRQKTADDLGIHKTTLFRRMKRLGITPPGRDGRSTGA
jgi:PAS domain S-box-containing protein